MLVFVATTLTTALSACGPTTDTTNHFLANLTSSFVLRSLTTIANLIVARPQPPLLPFPLQHNVHIHLILLWGCDFYFLQLFAWWSPSRDISSLCNSGLKVYSPLCDSKQRGRSSFVKPFIPTGQVLRVALSLLSGGSYTRPSVDSSTEGAEVDRSLLQSIRISRARTEYKWKVS